MAELEDDDYRPIARAAPYRMTGRADGNFEVWRAGTGHGELPLMFDNHWDGAQTLDLLNGRAAVAEYERRRK